MSIYARVSFSANFDSIWKKRFLQAMALRMCLSDEMCQLKEELALGSASQVKLELVIRDLKADSAIKSTLIQRMEKKSSNGDNDEMRALVDKALEQLEQEVERNLDRVKMNCFQAEVANLQCQIRKTKNMESLAVSETVMMQALYKDYNDVVACMGYGYWRAGSDGRSLFSWGTRDVAEVLEYAQPGGRQAAGGTGRGKGYDIKGALSLALRLCVIE